MFFFDSDIPGGSSWQEKLKNALVYSRCLVAIWSPNYFLSQWCNFECFTMLHREQSLSYRTLENPGGLIVPISVHDGERFPDFAKNIQYAPWQKFARVGEGFKKTERYVELQDNISEWVNDVANAINNAPEWNPDWLNEDLFETKIPQWLKDSNLDNVSTEISLFKAPSLS